LAEGMGFANHRRHRTRRCLARHLGPGPRM
jgi:hypothetical protein